MLIFKFLHILSMFAGVTLLIGGSVYFLFAARRRDPAPVAALAKIFGPLENIGVVFVVVGIVFGLVTAAVGQLDFTDGWLIVAYVLMALLFILGPIESRLTARVMEAATASPDAPSPEFLARLDDRRLLWLTIISTFLYVLIIADMVLKPF